MYDKDKIKNSLTINDVALILNEFNAEPRIYNGTIVSKTICHNGIGEGSFKLYYYNNTKLFHCYTGCEEPSFDIFELVLKVMNQINNKYQLNDAITFVAKYFGIVEDKEHFALKQLEDWKILQRYEDNQEIEIINPKVDLTIYNNAILRHLPSPHIIPWEEEGILKKVSDYNGIKFDPVSNSIIIPHYNDKNELIGIRQRTLIQEDERYGKYRPAYLNGSVYKHPLGFNLYNLNNSKNNIKRFGKAIVFESEKSTLLYQSYFGIENDISVAVCGFNLINYQFQLLMKYQPQEIIIAFDKQFKKEGDEEWRSLVKKYYNLNNKYGSYIKLSFMHDKHDLLDYKDSPIDKGKDIFMKLFKERITI